MFCTNCGNKTVEGTIFCNNCGTKMFTPTETEKPTHVAPAPAIPAETSPTTAEGTPKAVSSTGGAEENTTIEPAPAPKSVEPQDYTVNQQPVEGVHAPALQYTMSQNKRDLSAGHTPGETWIFIASIASLAVAGFYFVYMILYLLELLRLPNVFNTVEDLTWWMIWSLHDGSIALMVGILGITLRRQSKYVSILLTFGIIFLILSTVMLIWGIYEGWYGEHFIPTIASVVLSILYIIGAIKNKNAGR